MYSGNMKTLNKTMSVAPKRPSRARVVRRTTAGAPDKPQIGTGGYLGEVIAAPAHPAAESLYRAYETRDARFDGRFFVGVKTTGIFCRPVCPARTPLRRNVNFYASAAAAFAAGLRPCLRCRPERAPVLRALAGGEALVARALAAIDAGDLNEGSMEQLSVRIGVTSRHLRRLFETHLSATPIEVAQIRRLLFAKQLVEESVLPFTDIAYASGYNSVRRFNAAFLASYARAPKDLRHARAAAPPMPAAGLSITFPGIEAGEFARLLDFYRARAFAGVEAVDQVSYSRLIRLPGGAGSFSAHYARGALQLACNLKELSQLPRVVARVKRMFDLDAPQAAVRAHLSRDKAFAPALRATTLRVPCAWDAYELAVRAVLGQQVSVKAATTLAGRLVARFGEPVKAARQGYSGDTRADRSPSISAGLTHWFPPAQTLAQINPAQLQNIGLVRARAETLVTLARYIAATPEWSARYIGLDTFTEELTALPGIGPWTAQYIAMRGFADPDAFPAADLGLLRSARALGIAATPRELERHAERWRPWRAYAAQVLWNFDVKDAA